MSARGALLLAAVLLGSFFRIEETCGYLRLKGVAIVPPHRGMEEMLSQELKGMEEYVWPFALFDMPRFVTKVASVYPVEASWGVSGWGKIEVRVRSLEPFCAVVWQDQRWLVAKNGKVWRFDLPEWGEVKKSQKEVLPLIYWGNDMPPLILKEDKGDIYTLAFSVDRLTRWLSAIEEAEQIGELASLKFYRAGGDVFVEVRVSLRGRNVIVRMRDEPESWGGISKAALQLLSENAKGNLLLDASYKDKIILKEIAIP